MKRTIAITITVTALAFGQTVSSAILDQDWKVSGDVNVILDTTSNLRWLDLSITADISHDDVVANLSVGGMFEGWRLATQNEVLDLWSHASINNTERDWVTYQYPQVNDLVSRLGPTTMIELGDIIFATHAIGMVEGGPALPATHRWAMELTYAPDGSSTRTSASHYTWDVTVADSHYSTYLVQSVPLPSAAWLFGSGLLGLVGMAKRKCAV